MKKIKTVFVIDRENNICTNIVQSGSEWVLAGEGAATIKIDGTACMVRNGKLFKRMDRKLTKNASFQFKKDPSIALNEDMFKLAPEGWEACEERPDIKTGHWPGWVPVDENNPSDIWHIEAFKSRPQIRDGTYELVGPKIQSNKYRLDKHQLIKHGSLIIYIERDFRSIKSWLENNHNEGIVFHHPDGRMAKIRRKDFGLDW